MDYEKMEKKYKLPSFNKIRKMFWIEDEKDFLEISKTVSREIKNMANYLESLIVIDSYRSFIERSFLDEKDKEIILSIYKNSQIILKEVIIALISGNEKELVKWFKRAVKFWEENINSVRKIFKNFN